jgi:hypothetical protein
MKTALWVLVMMVFSACTQPRAPVPPSPLGQGSVFTEARRVSGDATHDAGWSLDERPSPLVAERLLPLGKQTHVAWARLLIQVHERLHPLFAEQYLRSLDELPPESPLSNWELKVQVELHLVPRTGEIGRMGVRRSSGVREFDLAVLTAFSRALPVPFPESLASSDGYAYVVWEVSRDPRAGCSAANARPIRIAPSAK